jgi:uncharacterized protein (DUF1684 family)
MVTTKKGMLVTGAVVASIGLLVSCGAEGMQTTLMHIRPTDGWESELLADRAATDRYFRNSPDTPLLAESVPTFEGLEYWEPDPDYYLVGQIVHYDDPEQFEIITTAGKKRPCEKIGYLSFNLGGATQTLQVYRLLDAPSASGSPGFFLPFMDETSGDKTYPGGRYVELSGPDGGPYVLDFNRAHNPYCAYGAPERFACPSTPAANRLKIPITVGEHGYHRRDEGGEQG